MAELTLLQDALVELDFHCPALGLAEVLRPQQRGPLIDSSCACSTLVQEFGNDFQSRTRGEKDGRSWNWRKLAMCVHVHVRLVLYLCLQQRIQHLLLYMGLFFRWGVALRFGINEVLHSKLGVWVQREF